MARRKKGDVEDIPNDAPINLDDIAAEIEGEQEDDLDADPAVMFGNAEADPDMEDLSDQIPGPIESSPTVINGVQYDDDLVGAPTSPPLWDEAGLHPNVQQLRVYKVIEGVDTHVGVIAASATFNDFVHKLLQVMPRPGEESAKFKLYPLNVAGKEIGKVKVLPPIHPEHTLLKAIRTGATDTASPGGRMANPLTGGLAETLQVVEKLTAPLTRRLDMAEQEARASREALIAQMNRMAEERIELAGRAGSTVEALAERSMANEAKRNEQALSAQQMGFQNMMLIMQTGQQAEAEARLRREREDADRRERERQAYETQITREREEASRRARETELEYMRRKEEADREWARRIEAERLDREDRNRREEARLERERAAEAAAAAERERERIRQHEFRMGEIAKQAERDREHLQRMTELTLRNAHNESPTGLVEQMTKLLGTVGITPADALGRFFGGGGLEEYAPVIDGLVQVATTGINNLGEYAKTRAVTEAAKAQQQVPAGAVVQQALTGPVAPAAVAAAPTAPGAPAPTPTTQQPAAPAPVVIQSKLALEVQAEARRTFRAFVSNVRNTPQEKWAELVQTTLSNAKANYYAKEQSFRSALAEAEADATLIDALCATVNTVNAPILTDIPISR